jgi:predicted MFS family arabinose efflux permease
MFLLQGIAFRGAKILISLSALAGHATPFQVGVLAAMFAIFPMVLAVYAGKFADRAGVSRPIVRGSVASAIGLLVPVAIPGLGGLMVGAALLGVGHIFFHVATHILIGGYGVGEVRTRNFATLSLGGSIAAFIGPALGGISIDFWGYPSTHMLLAAIAMSPVLVLLAHPGVVPQRVGHAKHDGGGSLELLREPNLRRTLIMSGVTLTGIELFTFYFPVYGRSVGLSPSSIGMVMSMYAVSGFLVRMAMPRATRYIGEVGVLTLSLFIAGAVYMVVPFFSEAGPLAAIAFLLGIGLGCAQPLTIILTYNHAPPGRAGEALGLRLTVNKLAQVVVPLAFGAMGSAFGILPVFWANGVFLLGGGLMSLAQRQRTSRRNVAGPPPDTPDDDA